MSNSIKKQKVKKEKQVYRPSKTHKRVSSGIFGIFTGFILIAIGLFWIIVTKKLIDIDGFGFGDVVNFLPYVGIATAIVGLVVSIYAIAQATRGVPGKKDEPVVPAGQQTVMEVSEEESSFAKNRIKGIIFDLDGTLLDTLADLTNATNDVLRKHGYESISQQQMKKLVGNGLYNVMRRGLPEDSDPDFVQATYLDLLDAYQQQYMNLTKPYEGIVDVVNELYQKGYLLAVLSNKREEYTQQLIAKFFPDIRFVDVIGESDLIPKKPDPTSAKMIADAMMLPQRSIVFVGDSNVDMITAKNANMTAVGVSWGFQDVHTLKDYGMDYYVTEPKDLLDLLRLLNKKE